MRILLVLFGIFCTASIITEALIAGILWQQGTLTSEVVLEIQDILTGTENKIFGDEGKENDDKEQNNNLVVETRVMRILKLEQRMAELEVMKDALKNSWDDMLQEKKDLHDMEEKYNQQRIKDRQDSISEATKKAQAILTKLSPSESVIYLMKLTTEENVTILKGMQDKQIVAILSQFIKGRGENADKDLARGHEIFNALSVVKPIKGINRLSEVNNGSSVKQ